MTLTEACQSLREMLDRLMAGSTAQRPLWNQELLRSGKPNRWNYIDGCMILAILAMGETTGEAAYLRFAEAFIGWFVTETGDIRTYRREDYNLDDLNAGKTLFPLYEQTGNPKYRLAMDALYAQLQTAPRTREGNFWHKQIYPWQVWLDGLYMAQPFYMEYETRYHGMRNCADVFAQFQTVRRRMRDAETGLYYHGYDESRAMPWANRETGCSANFWLRATGWLLMALVDCLACMSEELYYEYRTLQTMLRELVDALLPWQYADGMFYQVVNYPGEPGNYLESSGSAIVAYGLLKAARLGFLPARYREPGIRAFIGTAERYLTVRPDGMPQLGGTCLVAGLGGEQCRNGSRAYYYGEPVVANEAKGLAPMMMALSEVLRLEGRPAVCVR